MLYPFKRSAAGCKCVGSAQRISFSFCKGRNSPQARSFAVSFTCLRTFLESLYFPIKQLHCLFLLFAGKWSKNPHRVWLPCGHTDSARNCNYLQVGVRENPTIHVPTSNRHTDHNRICAKTATLPTREDKFPQKILDPHISQQSCAFWATSLCAQTDRTPPPLWLEGAHHVNSVPLPAGQGGGS